MSKFNFNFYKFNSICFLLGRKQRIRVDLQRAFTLVELLIGVAIITTLTTVTVYSEYVERGKVMQGIADINSIDTRMATYELINNGRLPDSLADIGMDGLLDPWGNPYQFLNLSNMKGKGTARKDHSLVPINSDYDLYSMGKDGKSMSPLTAKSSRDDIVRANNGRFVGKASDY